VAISSLVIDIADDADGRAAEAALAADPRFTLGPVQGSRRAVVLDTPSALDDTDVFDWLRDLPGVRWVTVVRVYLDDEVLPVGAAATFL